MHIGHGSSPTMCCKYIPNASMATQPKLTSASKRRGAVSIQVKTIVYSFIAAKAPTKNASDTGGLVQKYPGTPRSHHHGVALFQPHVAVLLRRDVRFNYRTHSGSGRIVR